MTYRRTFGEPDVTAGRTHRLDAPVRRAERRRHPVAYRAAMAWDVQPFLDWVSGEYEPAVRVGDATGAYGVMPGEHAVDLYGTCDMACVRYSLRALPLDPERRRHWAGVIGGFQSPVTGHFVERGQPSHVELHATAYAIAALELLDHQPVHPLRFAEALRSPPAVASFLDALDWTDWVYLESHAGAGVGSIFANVPSLGSPPWFDAYFAALDAHLDPANGMHGDAKPSGGDIDQIGGTFHYAFLHETFRRRLAHAEARIDAVLGLQRSDGLWDPKNPLWLTLDAVYLLSRGVQHTGHRRADVEAAIDRSLGYVTELCSSVDGRRQSFCGPMGTHALTAAVSLLAESQAFRGSELVRSDVPLRLVLDRRPFV
jgi:hypothetical protein